MMFWKSFLYLIGNGHEVLALIKGNRYVKDEVDYEFSCAKTLKNLSNFRMKL